MLFHRKPQKRAIELSQSEIRYARNAQIALKAFDEKLIPLMQEENTLVTRYDKLIASAKLPFEGEIYNLSLIKKFMK